MVDETIKEKKPKLAIFREMVQNARRIGGFGDLEGIEFLGKVDWEKDQNGLRKIPQDSNVGTSPPCRHRNLMNFFYAFRVRRAIGRTGSNPA